MIPTTVNPFTVIFEEPVAIIQSYNRSRQNSQFTDIFQTSLSAFRVEVWFLICMSLFLVGFLNKIKVFKWRARVSYPRRLMRQNDGHLRTKAKYPFRDKHSPNPFWEIFCFFIQQEDKEYPDFFRKCKCSLC